MTREDILALFANPKTIEREEDGSAVIPREIEQQAVEQVTGGTPFDAADGASVRVQKLQRLAAYVYNIEDINVGHSRAAALTAESYATQPVDEFVIEYRYKGNGAFERVQG